MATEIQTDTQRPTDPASTAPSPVPADPAVGATCEPFYRFEARLDFHPVGLVRA